MIRRAFLLLAVLLMLGNPSPASADLLSVNGGFESGFHGWTSSGVAIVDTDTFEGLAVDNPGNGHFARLGLGGSLLQVLDLSGQSSVTLSFDYRGAAWDVGVPSGSSAPMLSPSVGGRELWVSFSQPGGAVLYGRTKVSYDDPWDGTCWVPDPQVIIPRCSDGTPSLGAWQHFSQTWSAPAGMFAPGTELRLAEFGGSPTFFDERSNFYIDNVEVEARGVPEPATGLLLAVAAGCLATRLRRR